MLATCIPMTVLGAGVSGDAERGRGLYEQRCTQCHAQSVHARAKRAARDFNEVREWVQRWSEYLSLAWGDEEVEDVTFYLNATYYRYAVPAGDAPRPRPGGVLSSNALRTPR